MKKLLGILGTITISGSGMVGLVGNAPAPTQEKSKRNKRDNNVNYSKKLIYRFNTGGSERVVGDVYFGTTNGVYLEKLGTWKATIKIKDIDGGAIAEIKSFNNL